MAKKKNLPSEDVNPQEAATERETAPDTVTPDPEKEALIAAAEQAKAEAKALEDALARSEQLRREQEAAAIQPPPPPPVAAPVAHLPRNMQVKRTGFAGSPMTTRWPDIRGGTCEFCGVLDRNVPSQYQYKLCGHYRGMQALCTYCPAGKDADEIIYHSNLQVATNPDNPNELIMWCNSTACSDAHIKRFNGLVS